MKVTKKRIQEIIKEEIGKVVTEAQATPWINTAIASTEDLKMALQNQDFEMAQYIMDRIKDCIEGFQSDGTPMEGDDDSSIQGYAGQSPRTFERPV